MSNYSTFFPTGSGGGGAVSTPGNRLNRRIFCGAGTCTWPVPTGTTSIEVHVWGGGGGGTVCCASGGGGGGGYARAEYIVTDSDSLSITIGGEAATSSISIPTQSPGSPLSATGGSNSTDPAGGSGGSGSVSLHPTFPQSYCMTASGGSGGDGCSVACSAPFSSPFGCPGLCVFRTGMGGGGSAGSPRGPGGNGGTAGAGIGGACCNYGGGGGGIGHSGKSPTQGHAGGSRDQNGGGGLSNNNQQGAEVSNQNTLRRDGATRANCREDIWWKVEDIKGAGGQGYLRVCNTVSNNRPMAGGKGAGGAGGVVLGGSCCSPQILNTYAIQGARGGFLGGGGGNVYSCFDNPTSGGQTCITICQSNCDGKGGAAGGSGGGQSGTPGVVIIYW